MPAGRGKKNGVNITLPAELLKHYDDQKKDLGAGGFAKVILAEHIITKEKVAIKVMNKSQLAKKDDLHRAYNEIYALKNLGHQHISKMYEVYETKDYIYLVLEYCPGGELFDYIVAKKRLPEKEARDVFRQVASAVAFIHDNGYAHRDLKPENMLLDKDKKIKLIDFGLSAKPENGLTSPLCTRAGSALYASPELISGVAYYGDETDVWSLGVVLYALLCGFLPFDHNNVTELYKKIKKGEFATPPWLSPGSIRLLKSMLAVDSNKRITMQELLKDEWLCDGFDNQPIEWESNYTSKLNQDAVRILAEYYNWTASETEAKVLEYKYDSVTALYYILSSMPDTLLQKFRNNWLNRSHITDEEYLCPLSMGENRIHSLRFVGTPHQKHRTKTFVTLNDDTATKNDKNCKNDKSNDKNNDINGKISKPRARTLDSLDSNTIPENGVVEKFSKTTVPPSSPIVENGGGNSPTTTTPPDLILTTKPRSRTFIDNNNKETDDLNTTKTKEKCGVNEDSSADNRRRSTFSVLRRRRNTAGANTTRKGDETQHVVNGHVINGPQPKTNNHQVWRLWQLGGSNLKKTKRMAASCNDALDESPSCPISPEHRARENRIRTTSMREFTKRLSHLFKHREEKPRRVKAIYHVENTSTLPPDDVRKELERVLNVMVKTSVLASFNNPERYLFRCKGSGEKKTVFELEVCLVPLMDNIVGIRRKRLKGDGWQYKEIVETILSNAKV